MILRNFPASCQITGEKGLISVSCHCMTFCYLQSPIMASMPLISALIVGNMRRRSLSEVMVTVVRWKESDTSSHQATCMVFLWTLWKKIFFATKPTDYILLYYTFGHAYINNINFRRKDSFSAEKKGMDSPIRCRQPLPSVFRRRLGSRLMAAATSMLDIAH